MANIDASGNEAKGEIFRDLEIQERVLITQSRTTAIANISNISVGTIPVNRPLVLLLLGIFCILFAGYHGNSIVNSDEFRRNSGAVNGVILVAVVGAGMLLYFFRAADPTDYLKIATNDGRQSRFLGETADLIKVRDLLTEKINSDNKQATYRIDFSNGTIENLSVEKVEKVAAQSIVSGDNNQIASNSPGTKIATRDIEMRAENSPGAQVGVGAQLGADNVASANTAVASTRLPPIDYSQMLGDVATLQAHFKTVPNMAHVEARLSELERLMVDGAPSEPERSRLRELAADLSTIVAATPQWVQFFTNIARMAGV